MLAATVGGLMPPGISRLPFVSGHAPVIAALVIAILIVPPVVLRLSAHARGSGSPRG